MNTIIELTGISTYKDGGSVSYKGNDGKKYWRSYKISHKNTPNYGRIFEGNINNKNPKIAKNKTFEIKNFMGVEGIIQ